MSEEIEVLNDDPLAEGRAREAFAVENEIKHCITLMRAAWLQVAENLHRFHTQRMWAALGYPSFEQWMASPEIDLKRRQVFGLIEVWEQLVVQRHVDVEDLRELPMTRITAVLPAVRRGQVKAKQALSDARVLGREDLRVRYALSDPWAGPDTGTGLDPSTEPDYAICPACGQSYSVKR
jgi:hypothetical protein